MKSPPPDAFFVQQRTVDFPKKKYQIWHYTYATGYPILTSANMLREQLDGISAALQRAGLPPDRPIVLAYSSSHLDGAESELDVKTGHPVTHSPKTEEEVLRIQELNLEHPGKLSNIGGNCEI